MNTKLWLHRLLVFASMAIFLVQCKNSTDEEPVPVSIQDFEMAWNHINDHYPLLEFKNIDWDDIQTTYHARAELADDEEMVDVLSDLVEELKDAHANIYTADGTKIRPYTPHRRIRDEGKLDIGVIRTYFNEPMQTVASGRIEYQFLNDGIGYVRVPTFGKPVSSNVEDFETVFTYFENAAGLIIDVRENNGGSGLTVNALISYLIAESIPSGYQLKDNEVLEFAWVDPHPSIHFNQPVVVLINGGTFSAAEVFAYKLNGLENITIAGDTTAGGGVGNNSDPFLRLPSGKAISINDCAILRTDSVVLEWNGVPPNVYAHHTIEALTSGRDLQLEFALDLLIN